MYNSLNPQEQAVAHLEKKYGESFEVVKFYPKNIDARFDEFFCENTKNEIVKVYIHDSDEEYQIQDNYYGILKKDEYKEILYKIISDYIPEYKHFISFRAGYFDNKYTKDFPVCDAIKENKYQFFANNYIFIKETAAKSFTETEFNKICTAIGTYGMNLSLSVYKQPDAFFDEINESDRLRKYLPTDISEKPLFDKIID